MASPCPDDSTRAVELLRRAARAHSTLAYEGTRMVSAWGADGATTLMLRVRHLPGQGTLFGISGGRMDSSALTFVAEREIERSGNDALEGGPLRLLIDNYALRVTGTGAVAGRRAVVVTASHADVATARFWVDRTTGLLLRREVYAPDGSLAGASAFVDVHIEPPRVVGDLAPTLPQPVPQAMSVTARHHLTNAGWKCLPALPEGFSLTDVQRIAGPPPAVHSAYSDGLSTVSVFQQHGTLDTAALTGYDRLRIDGAAVYIQFGLPTYLTWSADGTVYTAVTDAPVSYVRQVVLSYPHGQPDDLGFWERLWRGIGRLLGWVAPLSASA